MSKDKLQNIENALALLRTRQHLIQNQPTFNVEKLRELSFIEQQYRQNIVALRREWQSGVGVHRDPTQIFQRALVNRRRVMKTRLSFQSLTQEQHAFASQELSAWANIPVNLASKKLQEIMNDVEPDRSGIELFQNCLDGLNFQNGRRAYVDLETTALHPSMGEIIEIGIVVVENGQVVEEIDQRFGVNDEAHMGSVQIHNISADAVRDLPKFTDLESQQLLAPILNEPEITLIFHHRPFEFSWLSTYMGDFYSRRAARSAHNVNTQFTCSLLDTRFLSSLLLWTGNNSLKGLSEYFHVPYVRAHSGIGDARLTHRAHVNMINALKHSPRGHRPEL